MAKTLFEEIVLDFNKILDLKKKSYVVTHAEKVEMANSGENLRNVLKVQNERIAVLSNYCAKTAPAIRGLLLHPYETERTAFDAAVNAIKSYVNEMSELLVLEAEYLDSRGAVPEKKVRSFEVFIMREQDLDNKFERIAFGLDRQNIEAVKKEYDWSTKVTKMLNAAALALSSALKALAIADRAKDKKPIPEKVTVTTPEHSFLFRL